jgi:hypothetical protein
MKKVAGLCKRLLKRASLRSSGPAQPLKRLQLADALQ